MSKSAIIWITGYLPLAIGLIVGVYALFAASVLIAILGFALAVIAAARIVSLLRR